MKIRPAEMADALPMAHVIVDTFLSTNRGVLSEEAWQRRKREWTYEVSAGNWKVAIEELASGKEPLCCLYVAEDETGEVVGLAYGCPVTDAGEPAEAGEIGEVDILYVSESHQRKGIGRLLVQATAAHLALLGMTKLRISTPVGNVEGRKFYERIGGQVVGSAIHDENGEAIPLVVYGWPDMQAVADMGNAQHPHPNRKDENG